MSAICEMASSECILLYEHCDVALSTYKGETTVAMPIKAFDYLRYGVPVVNSLGRDFGQFVRRDRIGLNYDAESPSSLYEALKRLVCDDALRRTCAKNARRLAEQFRPEAEYSTFVEILRYLSDGS